MFIKVYYPECHNMLFFINWINFSSGRFIFTTNKQKTMIEQRKKKRAELKILYFFGHFFFASNNQEQQLLFVPMQFLCWFFFLCPFDYERFNLFHYWNDTTLMISNDHLTIKLKIKSTFFFFRILVIFFGRWRKIQLIYFKHHKVFDIPFCTYRNHSLFEYTLYLIFFFSNISKECENIHSLICPFAETFDNLCRLFWLLYVFLCSLPIQSE